jgi:hypothetical protein
MTQSRKVIQNYPRTARRGGRRAGHHKLRQLNRNVVGEIKDSRPL